jgi:integrase
MAGLKHPEVYSYSEIKDKITGQIVVEYKAFFALMYATGGRVSEVLSIEAGHIQLVKDGKDRDILRVYSSTLKKREDSQSKSRFVAINVADEQWLTDIIYSYSSNIVTGLLFTQHRATIWRWAYKVLGFNPHGLRKVRATHLATVFDFDGQQLKRFFNWSSSNMADYYVGLKLEDITPTFKKAEHE